MQKYLLVVLKNGERRKYRWDDIDFTVQTEWFVIREIETGVLLFCTSVENLLYYERIEKEEDK